MENCAYTNPETAEYSTNYSAISRNSSRYRRGKVTKMIVRMMLALSLCPFTIRFATASSHGDVFVTANLMYQKGARRTGDSNTGQLALMQITPEIENDMPMATKPARTKTHERLPKAGKRATGKSNAKRPKQFRAKRRPLERVDPDLPRSNGRHDATTYNTNGSIADVQSKVNSANDGDTITLPAGSLSWAARVSITKNITLQGAGTSATGGGDQTVITDNSASGSPLLAITVNSSGVFRMTGITVQSGLAKDGGIININGPGNVRIDHCHLNATSTTSAKAILLGTGVFGVMDHCILDFTGGNAIYIYNGRQGAGDWMGNLEWSLPTNFGSADYFFIEDNIINGNVPSGAYNTRVYDGFTATKVVLRFNTLYQTCTGETHATGHAPDDRGLRSQEVYGNSVTSSLAHDPNYNALNIGNGTTLVWGNSWDQVYKNIFTFNVTRKNNGTYPQIRTPNGWGYAGTAFNGTGSNWDGGTALGTDTTNGYPCLDQPGRGQGDLITGGFPNKVNSTTGTIHWPNQALEPIYMWNNIGGIVPGWGGSIYADASGGRVVANRDYYPSASGEQTSPTSPFNGSSGTGWGTLANRPTTCTPGVAYFATDQGSWNTSTSNPCGVQQNGASGVLYKCTAPNTWTLYYTPYTYPHPLQWPFPPIRLSDRL